MKKVQINYCLINMLKSINKFFVDNWFGKTIITKNKDKVKLSANAILNKFLRKIIALNIISLVKTREVMARESVTINHNNDYLVINNTIDISKII